MKTFKVVLEQDPQGKWTLTVPSLPGYLACGESEDEVLQLAQEGIAFHLECLRDEGLAIPEGEGVVRVTTVEITT